MVPAFTSDESRDRQGKLANMFQIQVKMGEYDVFYTFVEKSTYGL